jgi:hypothetical protein
MQRAREVFYLYFVQNALTIALCIALGRHSIAGLTSSVSIAYTAAAVMALAVLARHQIHLSSVIWSLHVRRSLWASLAAAVATAIVYAIPTWTRGIGLIIRFGLAVAAGAIAYLIVVALQHRHHARTAQKGARLKEA